jgi:hypothetical protein
MAADHEVEERVTLLARKRRVSHLVPAREA